MYLCLPNLTKCNAFSQVFVGTETQQGSGAGYHLNAPLFPTMERTSLDLQTPVVAAWNRELLHCGGMVARVFYEAQVLIYSSSNTQKIIVLCTCLVLG
jgi:Protein of unknown function (DUF3684)